MISYILLGLGVFILLFVYLLYRKTKNTKFISKKNIDSLKTVGILKDGGLRVEVNLKTKKYETKVSKQVNDFI